MKKCSEKVYQIKSVKKYFLLSKVISYEKIFFHGIFFSDQSYFLQKLFSFSDVSDMKRNLRLITNKIIK